MRTRGGAEWGRQPVGAPASDRAGLWGGAPGSNGAHMRAREGAEWGVGAPASNRAGLWGGAPGSNGAHMRAREGAEWGVGAPASDRAGVWGGAPPRMTRASKIYLVGFMGAGKSTLARALGTRLDWRVEDIDTLVEQRERLSVADIFARRGEPRFRALERQVLTDLLPARHVVIATGGGTFADSDNRTLINRDGISIWLDVSLKRVIERLPTDGRRPLAADRSDMERLFHARQSAYRHAHMRLDAERASTGELVERVLDRLESSGL